MNTTDRHGWVSSPDGRGTFDILWNCLFTSFLCTWVSLHLNVPAPEDGETSILVRKLRWMLQAILGPEFVLAFATGQRAEAKRCLEAFRSTGHEKWTLRHAFYANMGGFTLQSPDHVPFPINGKQILWLVDHGFLRFPEIDERSIWDKSKADTFAKCITCVQTVWLVVHCVFRAVQQLPVTTLELTTVSFVICNIATYYQWSQKPLDVYTPTVLTTHSTMSDILMAGGEAASSKPYRQTPLDFIDDQSPSWLINVQPHFRFPPVCQGRRRHRRRPLTRFTNDRFPVVGAEPNSFALFFINMAYSAVHVIGWNFDFPTEWEKRLWRASSLAIIVTTFIFWMCEAYQDGVRLGRWRRWWKDFLLRVARLKTRTKSKVRGKEKRKGNGNLHADADADVEGESICPAGGEIPFIPTWEVIIMTPVGAVYTLARTYIVVECFFGLRSLPAAAYQDVEWLKLIPHFA